MLFKIDWLSFTVRRPVGEGDTERLALSQIYDAFDDLFPNCYEALGITAEWTWDAGRTPYKASYRSPNKGVAIFLHPRLDHALIEISGKGCEYLSTYEFAADFLEAITPRLTRIDIAADMLTDTRPLDFVSQREPGRFKSHSEVVSESGETCYIGSRSSNRYARVYRYNPPHERAHLLRSEFVLKAEDAKLTAQAITEQGLDGVVKTLGGQFGWLHEAWDMSETDEAILSVWRPERREGKTLYWLADTVAPLLVRLAKDGTIDPAEWLSTHVLSKLP